jgi:hypothetical protein
MTNGMTLVGAGAPANDGLQGLDIDNMSTADARNLCRTLLGDLSFLAGHVPAQVGSLISTGITLAASCAAGAIDGQLGDKSNIGPVGLTAAMAVAMAVTAVVVKHPDWREAAAAGARGFGAPVVYELMRDKVEAWKDSRQLAAA